MVRPLTRYSLPLALGLILSLGGCAPGNLGLVVGNVVGPDDQGTYQLSNPAQTQGTYDVSYNRPYIAVLRMLNQMLDTSNNGTSGVPSANTNLVTVQALDVELRQVNESPVAISDPAYRVPVGAVVVPTSDGMTAGEALASAEIIPLSIRDQLAGMNGTVVVTFQAVGQTVGGAEVVSPEYVYPITVCDGCLRVCQEDMDGMALCRPSFTPGQDSLDFNCTGFSDAMGVPYPACTPGGT